MGAAFTLATQCEVLSTQCSEFGACKRYHTCRNLSHGAYLSFDLSSADRLKELLGALAVYAAGGYRALTAYGEILS